MRCFCEEGMSMVRDATAGQYSASQKENVLEGFVSRLLDNIQYFVI